MIAAVATPGTIAAVVFGVFLAAASFAARLDRLAVARVN